MSGSVDLCRIAFERYARSFWNVTQEMIERREVMDLDRYSDAVLQQMWQTFRAGWDARQNLMLADLA